LALLLRIFLRYNPFWNLLSSSHHKNFNNHSDKELLVLYRQHGELDVCAILFKRYAHLIGILGMKYLKNKNDSEDAAMEVFEILLVDLRKHEIENFPGWLYRVVKNHCLKRLRVSRKESEYVLRVENISENGMEFIGHEDLIEERITKEEQLENLEIAVDQLPVEQKECVKLFYLQQKRYKEVSDLTGYSLNEVKSYIQNGKRNLKNHLTNRS